IYDIFRTAKIHGLRKYEIIVFSDHGQEHVEDFHARTGKTLNQAIKEVFDSSNNNSFDLEAHDRGNAYSSNRAFYLLRLRKARQLHPINPDKIQVAAMGPV